MAKTKIEWATDSWNPICARDLGPVGTGSGGGWHCEIITPGCERCYAQRLNRWIGTHRPYLRRERPHVSVYLDEDILTQPLRWKRPLMVFVCSMTDLFGEWVTHEMLVRVFRVMSDAPQHTYQILTKRTDRMRDFMQWWVMQNLDQPPHNWWFGISVEDQRRFDERRRDLRATPATVRWISAEPLLGPIYLTVHPGVDWVIVGGESGPGARPMHSDWARSLRDQCVAAGVPFFFKQWGEWLGADEFAEIKGFEHSAPLTWDQAYGISGGKRCEHHSDGTTMIRVGKKAAGRELDGRTWDEYPRALWHEEHR